jgi:minor histocompatibility antigen H13
MQNEFKKAYVDELKEGEEKEEKTIETMSAKDAKMFPIMAGGTLCFLYVLIKYFGKDVVNKLIMVYLAVAIVEVFKELLIPVLGKAMDEGKAVLVEFKVEQIGLNVRISQMDIIGFVFSSFFVGVYVWSDNWLLNNAIAIFISVQGIQQIFLDTF